MDKRAGERGQFQSRVDGMVGGGGVGWRSVRVVTRQDNGLVSLQATSRSRCGGNRASSDFLFV